MGFGTKQTSSQLKQSDPIVKHFPNYKSATEGPTGVGGWLIFPIVGFLFVIINFSPALYNTFTDLTKLTQIFFGDPKTPEVYLPNLLGSISFHFLTISAYICLYKIFVSRRALRSVAVAHFLTAAVATVAFFWFSKAHTAAAMIAGTKQEFEKIPVAGILLTTIWVCIWCAYFIFSKRVANTFEKER
jgi:Protein of unknown function (DUF2569)